MGIFIALGIVLIYWIASKVEMYNAEKAYKNYQQKLKEMGLK